MRRACSSTSSSGDMSTLDRSAPEGVARQIGTAHVGPGQLDAPQIREGQIRHRQLRAAHVAIAQHRVGHQGGAELHAAQRPPEDHRAGEFRDAAPPRPALVTQAACASRISASAPAWRRRCGRDWCSSSSSAS
jgi:hypothetical protein